MSWSDKYKRSINCDSPRGFSQRAHCAARKKRAKGEVTKSKSPFNEMHEVKSHKSVEQIAKKHRLEVSFVKRQLEMGIPIEHEHTKDKDLATDIALQHLDEIPDYYTRLKKMEASAKKEHKKFKDVKEGNLHQWFKGSKSKEGKPGWVNVVTGGTCASDEPGEGTPKCVSSSKRASMTKAERLSASKRKKAADPGQQQKTGAAKPTYVSTDKRKMEEAKDHEYSMARSELSTIMNAAKRLKSKMGKSEGEIEAWVQSKITKAADYLDTAADYVDSGEMKEETDKKEKGSGKKDACYNKVKSRYDVWPSAYASGALVKCRKVGAANWGTKSEACWDGYKQEGMKKKGKKMVPNCVPVKEENMMLRYCPKCAKEETRDECKYGPRYWDTFSMPIRLKKYTPNTPHPGNFPESYNHMQEDSSESKRPATPEEKAKIKKMQTLHRLMAVAKSGRRVSDIAKESVSIEDANGNHYAEFIDIIKPEPLVPSRGIGSRLVGEGLLDDITIKQPGLAGQPTERLRKLQQANPGAAEKIQKEIDRRPTEPRLPFAKGKSKKETQVAHFELEGGNLSEAPGDGYIGPPQLGIKNPLASDTTRAKTDAKRKQGAQNLLNKGGQAGLAAQRDATELAIKQLNQSYEPNLKTFNQFMIEASAAWQRKEGKNPEGGLNKKGIASYRREHPGSKLSLAVTTKPSKLKKGSKAAKRRKSFCARMSGMKKRLTSAKTANDPNSRINKSLRKWNC